MRTIALVLLCLNAAPAFAQRVVILEFEADKGNKLRSQVELALKKAATVELIPVAKWKDLATKKKLKGPLAMTPAAVARLARAAGVDAAVEGALGEKFFVRILDSTGTELWSRELPLKKGLLSDDHARKLAKAITAAAKTAPPSVQEEDETTEPKAEKVPKAEKSDDTVDPDQPRRPGDLSDEERAKRRKEEEAEAHRASEPREPVAPERDQDLDSEGKRVKIKAGPKVVRLWLAGTTTWRRYCSRPAVSSCAEYDNLAATARSKEVVVNFSPNIPYAGFSVSLEAFPIAAFTDGWAQGFGVLGNVTLGFSLTNVKISSASGNTPDKQVVSQDLSWSAELVYRYFFSLGSGKDTLSAYVGPRFGWASRVFQIDPNAAVALPGTYRLYPQVGIDGAIQLGTRLARFEAGFTYFIGPKPGPDEIAGYGDPNEPTHGGADGTGFGFEAGFSGDVFEGLGWKYLLPANEIPSALGYSLKVRYARYVDKFYGAGGQWRAACDSTYGCGGAAEEEYWTLIWGLTGAF